MKKINLLILDDKEENIISLEALLSEIKDINIISTTDPNHALKICWKNEISIALVDVQMPDINGFEFVSLLKENPKTSHILAIMVTAISKEDKFLLQGLQSGAIDYLYKPLNPEITIAKVKSFKICWKNEISIALVDVQMPDINGFEFVSLLKENPKTSHILAIMVTAISKEDKFLLQGLQSGAIDYLYKPLNPEITIAKVKSF